MKNVLFVGGIHGVGKGTFCEKVGADLNIQHLSASDVLKWSEISNKLNKSVENFSFTQQRLITNLKKILKKERRYIVDGHYCLLNFNQKPEKIDIETFKLLDPFALAIIIDKVEDIKFRLEKRDNKEYELDLLYNLQKMELDYSKELAVTLSKPYLVLKRDDADKIKGFLLNNKFCKHRF